MKITNPNYRKFLDDGEIDPLQIDHLTRALKNVTGIHGKYITEGRALLIFLYYTGARPIEALKLKAKHIYKDKSYLAMKIPKSKKGKVRIAYLQFHKRHVKELYDYAIGMYEDMFIFWHYRSAYVRVCINKKGEISSRQDLSNTKIGYYIKKWFQGVVEHSISPYFLRHNIFSLLVMAGADESDIKHLKGAKSMDSVEPYLHLSPKKAKKIAKFY